MIQIDLSELDKHTFVCTNLADGEVFGQATSFDGAMQTIAEWLAVNNYHGRVEVQYHPLNGVPYFQLLIQKIPYLPARSLWHLHG